MYWEMLLKFILHYLATKINYYFLWQFAEIKTWIVYGLYMNKYVWCRPFLFNKLDQQLFVPQSTGGEQFYENLQTFIGKTKILNKSTTKYTGTKV
jgi:hypothetical protein